MVKFYDKILQGTAKATALREAQREMIAQLKDVGEPASPSLWGAFVCVGDPGKLQDSSSEVLTTNQSDKSLTTNRQAESESPPVAPDRDSETVQPSPQKQAKKWWKFWKRLQNDRD